VPQHYFDQCWIMVLTEYVTRSEKISFITHVSRFDFSPWTEWYMNLIQNSPAVKKCAAPRMLVWKKIWNPKWLPRNGCDGRLKAKILITTIQVNSCCLLHVSIQFGTKFTWIVVIKNLPLAYHHSHYLATTLDFTSFFTTAFLGPLTFLQLGCFGLDFTSFCNCIL